MSADHLDDLRAQARYARDRFALYRARAYGSRLVSQSRMRELERAADAAAERLAAAEADEGRGGPPTTHD